MTSEGPASDNAPAEPETVVELPPQCDLKETETVVDKFVEAAESSQIVIDASGVEEMSAPCVLAVVSLARFRTEKELGAVIQKPSPQFIDAFTELGLFEDLMKMEFRT